MTDPVPAVTEAAATGETAEIFADIRAVLGVEVVNLIWRHLATIPGALPWAWRTVRPLYVDGTIAAEAERLHGDLALPVLPPLPAEALRAAGLGEEDVARIRAVLSAYDRTNAMALVALSAVLNGLAGDAAAMPGKAANDARPATAGERATIPLPRLLTLEEMAPATAALVLALNRLGTRREDAILASMYRHLAHWPAYLALTWALVAPLDADGRLEAAIDDALTGARARAARLTGRLAGRLGEGAATPPEPALAGRIAGAIAPFADDVIAKMVVICAILRGATR